MQIKISVLFHIFEIKMLRIGYDAKRFFHNNTGLGNYSRDLIRILSNSFKSHQYFLFDSAPSPLKQDLYPSTHCITPTSYLGKTFPKLWRSRWLTNMFPEHQLDIYHGLSAELPNGNYGQTKSIVTIHDLIFKKFPDWYQPIDRWIYTKKMAHACAVADKIICISQQTAEDLIEAFPETQSKITIIYQSCHPTFQNGLSAEKEKTIANKWKHHLPDAFILSVGTIEPRKNLLNGIKALQDTDIPLVVVGKKTKYYNEIQGYISKHQMQKQILFLDNVAMDELVYLNKKAKLSIYLSLYEGFGIPIIESLFMKTPVITNKNGVFKEAAGPGGKYVDIDNIDATSHAIKTLWNDQDERNTLAQKGYHYVQRFTDQVIGDQMISLYHQL